DQLRRLGIVTIRDLLRHYPTRYDDLRAPVRIADLDAGPAGEVNVLGVIAQFRHVRLRGRIRSKSTALIEDGSGQLQAVWFGRPYLGTQLKPGMKIFVRGRSERTLTGPRMSVTQHRVVDVDEAFEGRLEPVYPLTSGLQSRTLRRLIGKALPLALRNGVASSELDPLPARINSARHFKDARWALRAIHQPNDFDEAAEARRRLVFEEFFLLATATALRRAARNAERAPDIKAVVDARAADAVVDEFKGLLP